MTTWNPASTRGSSWTAAGGVAAAGGSARDRNGWSRRIRLSSQSLASWLLVFERITSCAARV
jgi:hypothetical protein